MNRTCSQCDSEYILTVNQEPLCERHAEKRLDELKSKKEVIENKVEELQEEYDRLKNKYNVSGYGEIEHQLNVEGREDITEDDVQKLNNVESDLAYRRQELSGVEERIRQINNGLN